MRKKLPSRSHSVLRLDRNPIVTDGGGRGGVGDGGRYFPTDGDDMQLSLVDAIDGATRVLVRERATGKIVLDCLVTAPYIGQLTTLLQLLTPCVVVSPPAGRPPVALVRVEDSA